MPLSDFTTGAKAMASLALISKHGWGATEAPLLFTRNIHDEYVMEDVEYVSASPLDFAAGRGRGRAFGFPVFYFNGHQPEIPGHTGILYAQWTDKEIPRTRGFVKQLWDKCEGWFDDFIANPASPTIDEVILAGHSLGGMFALCLAAVIKERRPQNKVEVYTFGMPRCIKTNDHAAWFARFVPHWRYILAGDVVPNLPPTPDQSWSALALYAWSNEWRRTVHDVRALNLATDETQYVWETPPPAGEVGINVLSWITEVARSAQATHSHFVYWPRITRRYEMVPARSSVERPGHDRGRREDPPDYFIMPLDLKRRAFTFREPYAELADNHASKSVPRSWSVQSALVGFDLVYSGVTVVANFRSRRSARKAAALLNSLGNSLVKSVDITQTELASAIQDVAATIEGVWEQP